MGASAMNEEQAFTYLTSRGFAPHQAAGILGNLAQESGFNPRAVGDGGAAYGLAQWRGPRRKALMDYATKSSRDPNAMGTQLDFLVDELQGPERRALDSLVSAKTPQEAAIAFSRDYERPGKPQNERRISRAQEIMNRVVGAGMPVLNAMVPAARADEIPPLPEGFELITDEPTTEQPRQLQAQELPPLPEGFELVTDEPISAPSDPEGSLLRDVGVAARGVAKGVASLPLMFGQGLNEAVNWGIKGVNAVAGTDIPYIPNAHASFDTLLNKAGLPEPQNTEERMIDAITSGTAAAVAPGGAANLLARAGGAVPRAFVPLTQNLGTQAASGAMSGGSSQIAAEMGAGPVGQAVAGMVGGMVPVTPGIVTAQRAARNAERQGLRELSSKHGIPLSQGDISKNPIIRKTETALENVPYAGMTTFRKEQAGAAEQAANRLLDRAADKLDDAGDWGRILQSSLKGKAKFVKDAAAKKYDRVAQLADPLGPVPTTRMNQTARELLGEEMLKPEAYQDAGFISLLRKYATEPGVNFSTTRAIRSDLGDLISDAYRGRNAIVGEKGAGALQKLKGALEDDMKQFATSRNPKVAAAWKDADRYYRETVVPFKDSALARAAKSSTPDEIYRTFIQRGKGDRAMNFYKALDQQGRDAVRYGMVKEAIDKATREGAPFSPAKFATSLENIDAATGVFFKGKNKDMLDGLVKLMRHAERGGQVLENPPTGQRVIPWLMAGSFAGPVLSVKTVAGSFAIQKLLTTERGQNFLAHMAKMKPGTDAMDNYLRVFGAAMAQQARNGGE
jgi:hypothetical protein